MPRCQQQSGRWLHTTFPSHRDCVWISETLLGNAFQNFIRSQKRHKATARSFEPRVASISPRRAYSGVASGLRITDKQKVERCRKCSQKRQAITNTQLRFASAIPGPLEARRRSSKRKNTSLAQFDRPPASIDSSVIFGSSRPHEWWNSRTTPNEEAPPQLSLLPSWLTNIVFPPEPSTIESHPLPQTEALAHDISSETLCEPVDQIYARELRTVYDLEAFRNLVQSLGISLNQKKEYVRQPLRLMLENGWQLEHIQTFLFDPFFWNPVSRKWREVYRYLSETTVAQERLHALLELSVEAIWLGLVDLPEIKSLIRYLPRVRSGDTILGHSPSVSKWYSKIIDAIDSSPVVGLASIGQQFQLQLTRIIVNAPCWEDTPSTLWRICPKTPESAHIFATSLDKWLQLRLVDAGNEDVSFPTEALFKFFCQLNNGDNVKGAIDGSIFLVFHATSIPFREQQMKAWIHRLGSLKASLQTSNASVDQSHLRNTNGMEKRVFRTSRQRALLIHIWTLRKLGLRAPDDWRSIVQGIWDKAQGNASPSLIPFCDLMADIQSLCLPYDETELLCATCFESLPSPGSGMVPLPRMVTKTRQEIAMPSRFEVSFEQLQDFAKSHILSMKRIFAFVDAQSWWYLSSSLQPLARFLSERVNESFDIFVRTGRFLVFQEPFAALMIVRILKFNLPFKIALSMSRAHTDSHCPHGVGLVARTRHALKEQKMWENEGMSKAVDDSEHNSDCVRSPRNSAKSASIPAIKDTRRFNLTPDGALETMEALAAAFAVTPVLTPRQAFRRVWQCYYILRRYQAPVRPVITQCLWHAGVKRYGKQGCSKVQLSWILRQVAQVEGPEKAEKLITKAYDPSAEDSTFWEDNLGGEDNAVVDQDTLTEARSWLTMDAPPTPVDPGEGDAMPAEQWQLLQDGIDVAEHRGRQLDSPNDESNRLDRGLTMRDAETVRPPAKLGGML